MQHCSDTFLFSRLGMIQKRARELVAEQGGGSTRADAHGGEAHCSVPPFAWALLELHPLTGLVEGAPCKEPLVRRTSRNYFNLVLRNATLPCINQLDAADLSVLRSAMLNFNAGGGLEDDALQRVFALLEEKLNRGRIAQAELILASIPFERRVAIFFEQRLLLKEVNMRFGTLSLGSDCVQPPVQPQSKEDDLKRLGEELERRGHASHASIINHLAEQWGVVLHVCVPGNVIPPEYVSPQLLEVPGGHPQEEIRTGRLWRPVGCSRGDTSADLSTTLTPKECCLEDYAASLLRTAYCVALLDEEAGHESFLVDLMGWYRRELSGERITMLSEIHREVAGETSTVGAAVRRAASRHLVKPLKTKAAAVQQAEVRETLHRILGGVLALDHRMLQPGAWSLSWLLWDELLGPGIDAHRTRGWELAWRKSRLL